MYNYTMIVSSRHCCAEAADNLLVLVHCSRRACFTQTLPAALTRLSNSSSYGGGARSAGNCFTSFALKSCLSNSGSQSPVKAEARHIASRSSNEREFVPGRRCYLSGHFAYRARSTAFGWWGLGCWGRFSNIWYWFPSAASSFGWDRVQFRHTAVQFIPGCSARRAASARLACWNWSSGSSPPPGSPWWSTMELLSFSERLPRKCDKLGSGSYSGSIPSFAWAYLWADRWVRCASDRWWPPNFQPAKLVRAI